MHVADVNIKIRLRLSDNSVRLYGEDRVRGATSVQIQELLTKSNLGLNLLAYEIEVRVKDEQK